MSKTRKQNTNILLLVAAFVGGIVCNRLMNHQNIVSGDVEEGMDPPPPPPRSAWVIIMIVTFIFFCLIIPGLVGMHMDGLEKQSSNYLVMKNPFGAGIVFTTVVALGGFWAWRYWHEFVVSGVVLILYIFLQIVGNIKIGPVRQASGLNPNGPNYKMSGQ